jgi:hypothetical protein
MREAGFKIAARRGSGVFYAARDTVSKLKYIRRRYVTADDSAVHPLLEVAQ